MKFAIYSRKSKFTGKGESIENQIEMCTDYIHKIFNNINDNDIDIFEDEGISGKNFNRPQFQQMMKNIQENKYQYIVVYRLDRISRNVGDFANLIEELCELKVSFISIKEQFDTSTPMGRAMMSIASVFAQLERETIAERVRDNMHMLARTGRWLGGTTPTGFDSIKDENVDLGDKVRTSYKLQINDEIDIVKKIYDKFYELQSFRKLNTYLINNDILTKKGNRFEVYTIRNILTNPVYCIADKDSNEYFVSKKCDISYTIDECNSINGFAVYNRTDNTHKRNKQTYSEWIVAVGKHEGIIKGDRWVEIQKIIEGNADKQYRKSKNSTALLSGIIKCDCGSYMRPKYARPKKDGTRSFVYMCELKEKSKREKCNISNISGDLIDEMVCNELFKFDVEDSNVYQQLNALKNSKNNLSNTNTEKLKELNSTLKKKETSLASYVNMLDGDISATTLKHIDKQIIQLDNQINEIKNEIIKLNDLEKSKQSFENQYLNLISVFKILRDNFNDMSIIDKRERIKSLVQTIYWNGKEINIFIDGCN